MAKSVPTKNSAMDAGKTQILEGAYLGVGETVGKGILGPGLGTMLGGLLVASTESGASRDRMATISGERAVTELMSASGGSSSGSSNQRSRM